ncbi:hypothetical protein [Roseovarius sp. D22-M7]|uniref:hypothetical protein n=1 Tax=Roseovarius sp. D22-M7 TaxID=3127116 RepID=UPI00300F8DB7
MSSPPGTGCSKRGWARRASAHTSRLGRLLETFEMAHVHGALDYALGHGTIGYDAVKHLVLCRIENRPPRLDLDIYPYLPRAQVETTDPASDKVLMSGTAA